MSALCPGPHADPRTPEPGAVLCRGCADRVHRDLCDLADILAARDALATTPAPVDGDDRRAARDNPAPPLDLAWTDLDDPRCDHPALHHLVGWAAAIAEDHRMTPPGGAHAAVRWLRSRHRLLCAHPAADEAAADVADAARRVRALAGLGPGPALFDCPEPTEGDDGLPDYDDPCGGPVRPIPWAFGVACRRCGAVWDGDERLRQLRLIASA